VHSLVCNKLTVEEGIRLPRRCKWDLRWMVFYEA